MSGRDFHGLSSPDEPRHPDAALEPVRTAPWVAVFTGILLSGAGIVVFQSATGAALPALLAGLALTLAAWALPRKVAGTPLRLHASLALDLMGPILGWLLLCVASAKPAFSGALVLLFGVAFSLGDKAKRAILHEPVVASDLPQFLQAVRHPRLAIQHGVMARAVVGGLSIVALFVVLFLIEPALWPTTVLPGLLAATALIVTSYALTRPPLLNACAWLLRKLKPTGLPVRDAASLGPLALLLTYGLIARAERPSLQARVMPPSRAPARNDICAPLLLVQCESFFDARRLHPGIPRDLLPAFDACCQSSASFGRLSVPGWGANTTRTEFAALTGLPQEALGFDRFNPYRAFARAPVASLAWEMRARGYRTFCIHPFDRQFFRRDQVMPNLGFDEFLGEEAFTHASRNGPYVADIEVAKFAADLLRREGPNVFIFAITMQNHGPWGLHDPRHTGVDPAPALPLIAGGDALQCYVGGLTGADAMIGLLTREIEAQYPGGMLAVYGDHLPSLPLAFDQLKFSDTSTDYVIWNGKDRSAQRRDLSVHQLPGIIAQLRGMSVDGGTRRAGLA